MMYQVHQRDAELRGERKKAVETARTTLQMALPLDMIARISGLTVEEIEKIRMESK